MIKKPELKPADKYNKKLLNNVHPEDWDNPEPVDNYNLVVIGAGTAGLVTAAGAAGLGAKVALIERRFMGGDCLNFGCVPSKSLIASARKNKILLHNAESLGENNFSNAMQRMREKRARISSHDSAARFQDKGVDVFLGAGNFTSEKTIEVDGQTLNFNKAVIATGGRPRKLELPGLKQDDYYTNETIFSLTEKPDRMAIIGAGPIGCELAQTFQNLGVNVTIIQRSSQILTKEDPDAAEIVYNSLLNDGVDIELNSKLSKLKKDGNNKILVYERDGKKIKCVVDVILVGIGRVPNIESLDLEQAGVEYNPSGIKVNDRLQTSNKKIYAAGDCCMKYKFTHAADAAARIVIANALFFGRQKLSDLVIPWCTYMEPEIAHVGLYPKEAKAKGIKIDTYQESFENVDRAVTDGEEEGLIKVHTKKGSDNILGATIVAGNAGDMISEITTAIVGDLGLGTLSNVIHPYPTQAEAIKKIADAYNRTRLTPLISKFLKWILKLTG